MKGAEGLMIFYLLVFHKQKNHNMNTILTAATFTKSFSPRVSIRVFTAHFMIVNVWPWTLPLLRGKNKWKKWISNTKYYCNEHSTDLKLTPINKPITTTTYMHLQSLLSIYNTNLKRSVNYFNIHKGISKFVEHHLSYSPFL